MYFGWLIMYFSDYYFEKMEIFCKFELIFLLLPKAIYITEKSTIKRNNI